VPEKMFDKSVLRVVFMSRYWFALMIR
jgi:hypothetical protein